MKRSLWLFSLLAALVLAATGVARPVVSLSYEQLTEGADLIVIGTPVEVRDTDEKTIFPGGVVRIGKDNVGRPIPAIGVETTFEVLSVLKGEKGMKQFVLHHLREVERENTGIEINALLLVSFDPKEKKRYLLFLKREGKGRYLSMTGQTDPLGAVFDLRGFP